MDRGPSPAAHYRANGKLMLTGEYLVLDGATALALPTRRGQTLDVRATAEVDVLHWRSRDPAGAVWFEYAYTRRGLRSVPAAVDRSPRARVARLLHAVLGEHPALWPPGTGLRLETRLEFPRDWGLGSSATLAYLLAALGGLDAFELNQREFGGSGYDVAAAGATGPLLYRLDRGAPRAEGLAWAPPYLGDCVLVHLGAKQDSRAGIRDYRARAEGELARYAAELDQVTAEVIDAADLRAFAEALRRHEALVGYVTHREPLSRGRFADFPGVVKSLGAWGGDFALAVPTDPGGPDAARAYFAARGLDALLDPAEELLLPPGDGGGAGVPTWSRPPPPGYWPVFLYGVLAEPSADNAWLAGHAYAPADLLDHRMEAGQPPRPVAAVGRFVPGTVAYVAPEEVRAIDLHPRGRGLRRTQLAVRIGGEVSRALVWL